MAPGARSYSLLKYLGVNYKLSEGLESGALIDKLVKAVNRARRFGPETVAEDQPRSRTYNAQILVWIDPWQY
jgi:hypothetical protein